MDPSLCLQIRSDSATFVLPVLNSVKTVVRCGRYDYGAVYQLIDGPYCLGRSGPDSGRVELPILVVLGRWRDTGAGGGKAGGPGSARAELQRKWPTHQAFVAEDLFPMDETVSRDGSHAPASAKYLLHIEILDDAGAHDILHSLGKFDFRIVPGWISESIFTTRSEAPPTTVVQPAFYVCLEAFDDSTDQDQLVSLLDVFNTYISRSEDSTFQCRIALYNMFGSVISERETR